MATKAKGFKALEGKQVRCKNRYSDTYEGPFTFKGLEFPYIELELGGESFWWHTRVIEGIQIYKEEAPETE